ILRHHLKFTVHHRHALFGFDVHVAPLGARNFDLVIQQEARRGRKKQHGHGQQAHCENTISPPTTVSFTRVLRIAAGGAVIMSSDSMTKSASLPASSDPLLFSSKAAYAPVSVQLRS